MEACMPENIISGTGLRFHRRDRLIKHEVVALLHDGIRLTRTEFFIRLKQNQVGRGRIAIAVPKRILKSAVDRNRVKRVIREEFRQHSVRRLPVDILVTLHNKVAALSGESMTQKLENHMLRETLRQLLRDVSRRFGGPT